MPINHQRISVPRKHHYVWRASIAQWANADGQVFFSRNGVIHPNPTNPENLMAQRDFNRLPDLSMEALLLVDHLAVRDPELDPVLRSNNAMILNLYAQFLRLKAQRDGSDDTTPEERERLEKAAIRLHENYLGKIEGIVAPITDSLRSGCTEVLRDTENRFYFYLFLGLQLFRTRKMRREIKRILRANYRDVFDSFDAREAEGVAMLYGQTFGQSVGGALFLRSAEYRDLILENEAEEPLIAGDQPLVNILAPERGIPEEMALYYPLSPRMAFLLLEKRVARRVSPIYSEMVRDLNLCVAAAAHECLVGDSLKALKDIEKARPFEQPDMRRWLVI